MPAVITLGWVISLVTALLFAGVWVVLRKMGREPSTSDETEMSAYLESAMILEIKRQSTFAKIASQDLTAALAQNDLNRIWYSTQSFLVAVGNLSKIFWPTKKFSR